MKPLSSVFDLEWHPRILVEASAGTGKTYTIVGIYIRLLLGKELPVNRILVMTFTNKATSELRDRILKRLGECLDLLQSGAGSDDPFLRDFQQWCSTRDAEEIKKRIQDAIRNFDDNRIFTIHGFCQKVLGDEALLAGVPLRMDVIQNDDLLMEAASDFWRIFMNRYGNSEGGRYYIKKLLKLGSSPAELIGRNGLGELFSRKEAEIEGSPHPDPVGFLEEAARLRKEISREWEEVKEQVAEEFSTCDLKYYTDKNISSRIADMNKFAADFTFSEDSFDKLKFFTASHVHDEENYKKNASGYVSKLPFFDLCEQFARHIENVGSAETALILEVHREITTLRKKLSEQSGSLTYDDLLIRIRDALQNPETGDDLSQRLFSSYPWALVDEFQDTDSIQYEIFNAIYPKESTGKDGGLMMIGDPKQAIYAFRGADVYTYFEARNDGSPQQWSLNKNFRSTPGLVEAVNRLFGDEEIEPFVEEQVTWFDSDCGRPDRENDYLYNGKPSIPFTFILKEGLESNKRLPSDFAYRQTVSEVIGMLDGIITIRDEATGEMRGLQPGDIAILVQSHRDAGVIKNRLKDAGIDSVTYSPEKVFDTLEAKRLEVVMKAVLSPSDRTAVNSALVTGLFGRDTEKLRLMREDEQVRTELVTELTGLSETWNRHGYTAMFRKLLLAEGRMEQLSALRNAERILTNLHQLADICSAAEQEKGYEPHELYTWYVRQMANPAKSDEQQLLLESDQNLVKISTIHGSKGLEFPVVICPMLWNATEAKKDSFKVYHKDGSGGAVINIDRQETDARVEAAARSEIESIAEEVRKAYVAITRARYDCRVIWATHNNSHRSGLAAALTGKQKVLEGAGRKLKEGDEEFGESLISGSIRALSENNPALFRISEACTDTESGEPIHLKLSVPDTQPPQTYAGRPRLLPQVRIESFSSLAGHSEDAGEPDHDQLTEQFAAVLSRPRQKPADGTIFDFPRGATPGTAIHKLFEQPDFRFDTAGKDDHSAMIKQVLANHAISEKWASVMQQMIRDVAGAGYGELHLDSVGPENMLREMEFHFPVREAVAAKLLDVIRKSGRYGQNTDPSVQKAFLTGFIDLIVRQNGRYYILDYKSNYLGDKPEDYTRPNLEREILAAGYDLQYHLYTAALIRFLKERSGEFDYERDFGGVFYLFVRGMEAGSGNGIWHHKPDRAVIDELMNLLEGGER
jgi:exodeoxyribonuclease V beta subunit